MRDAKIASGWINNHKGPRIQKSGGYLPYGGRDGKSLGAAAPILSSPPPLTHILHSQYLPTPICLLTGRPNLTASTGCLKGHAN